MVLGGGNSVSYRVGALGELSGCIHTEGIGKQIILCGPHYIIRVFIGFGGEHGHACREGVI